MKKIFVLTVCLLGYANYAAAQTKITGTEKCGKPDEQQSIDVGDKANHKLMLVKSTCSWAEAIEVAGVKAKSDSQAVFSDAAGAKSADRGYVVLTMENGDKAFVRFQGTGTLKDGAPQSTEGTWSFAGGTGKLKGLKGKGTYKGTTAAEGTTNQIEGEYTLPK